MLPFRIKNIAIEYKKTFKNKVPKNNNTNRYAGEIAKEKGEKTEAIPKIKYIPAQGRNERILLNKT